MTELLFKVFDLLLGGLISKWQSQRKLENEFESLKRKVNYTNIVNNLPLVLKELRGFLIENDLVENNGIKEFFSKWLTGITVTQSIPAANAFTAQQVAEIKNEISQIKL